MIHDTSYLPQQNALREVLYNSYPELLSNDASRIPMAINDGWLPILKQLFDLLLIYESEDKKPARIRKIVEKKGEMRVFLRNASPQQTELLNFFARKSRNVCSICGSYVNVGHTDGDIIVCCKECFVEYVVDKNDFVLLNWQENEDY